MRTPTAYAGGARKWRAHDTPLLIADSPSTIERDREVFADTFRAKTTATAGPWTVRIEPVRQSTVQPSYDEKGTGAVASYVLIGWQIPRTVTEGAAQVPTFRVGDVIRDTDNDQQYTVSSPPRWEGEYLELNLQLRG